ncbi:hypothetical protein [Methylophilus sp. 14]|uniref:hypothetical protein n=1 Tax=Methylophilus sp. 14 TaxID=2781019 RepID=UPI00189050F9|nr:hypothetical protein [Methylophilus sp. 14]MBF4986651.1 hypothetical protein [Methylophilus sp. 14]
MRERVIATTHANGVTAWALGVAILYLLVQAFPSISRLVFSLIDLNTFILFLAHTLGLLIGLRWLHIGLKGDSKFSKFDYRFLKRNPTQIISIAFSFLLIEGVYFLCSIIIVWTRFSIEVNGYEKWLFLVSAYFFGVCIAAFIYYLFESINDYSRSEAHPTAFSLRTRAYNTWKIDCVLIPLLLSNFVYLIFPTSILDIEQYKELVLLSFQIGLLLCCVSYYLSNFNNSNTLQLLNKLERDIVLHNLGEKEIKKRLQEEYFGNEFHTWLTDQFNEINELVSVLEAKLSSFNTFESELDLIDKGLKFERVGRIGNYQDDLNENLKSLNKLNTELTNSLRNCLLSVRRDNYLKSVINEKLTESEILNKRLNSEVEAVHFKLNAML